MQDHSTITSMPLYHKGHWLSQKMETRWSDLWCPIKSIARPDYRRCPTSFYNQTISGWSHGKIPADTGEKRKPKGYVWCFGASG